MRFAVSVVRLYPFLALVALFCPFFLNQIRCLCDSTQLQSLIPDSALDQREPSWLFEKGSKWRFFESSLAHLVHVSMSV